jgi:DUF218 domain
VEGLTGGFVFGMQLMSGAAISTKRVGAARRILPGLFVTLAILLALGLLWLCAWAEPYFSLNRPLSADVLIVEGWIESDGLRAAVAEYQRGFYKYVVVTGGLAEVGSSHDLVSYAELAQRQMVQYGIDQLRIITASSGQVERQRTFKSAVAAWQALRRKGVHPTGINVLTLGPHARRTQLVYEKVFASDAPVGVITFVPAEYLSEPWWFSVKRTKCLLKETLGYPFELFLNSGRISNSPANAS